MAQKYLYIKQKLSAWSSIFRSITFSLEDY